MQQYIFFGSNGTALCRKESKGYWN